MIVARPRARAEEGSTSVVDESPTAGFTSSDWVLWSVLGIGALLRIVQWASQRSFYLDEAALLLTVFRKPLWPLLSEILPHAQSAPPGFLALERLAFLVFGPGELGLRLFPLLAGLASLVLFTMLARRNLPALEALAVSALFAVSPVLIYFSSEAKPYAFDVLCTLVLLLAADALLRGTVRRGHSLIIAFAPFPLVFFSQPLVLVLCALCLGLVVAAWRDRERHRSRDAALVVACWSSASLLAVGIAWLRMTPESLEYMNSYWKSGFWPLLPGSLEEVLWLPRALLWFAVDPLGSPVPGLLILPAILGLLWFSRHNPRLIVLGFGPIAAVLGASAAGQYPFGANLDLAAKHGRIILFLVPSALLLIGGGLAMLRFYFAARLRRFSVLVLAPFVAPSLLYLSWIFPEQRSEIRPVLEYVEQRLLPGDLLYVDYSAYFVFEFYAPILGLENASALYGKCVPENHFAHRDEIESLRGNRRVWVVISSPTRLEVADFLANLDRVGRRLDAIFGYQSVGLLYDLSIKNITPAESQPPAPRFLTGTGCVGIFDGLPQGQRPRGSTWSR